MSIVIHVRRPSVEKGTGEHRLACKVNLAGAGSFGEMKDSCRLQCAVSLRRFMFLVLKCIFRRDQPSFSSWSEELSVPGNMLVLIRVSFRLPGPIMNVERFLPHVADSEWPEIRPTTHNDPYCALLRYYATSMVACTEGMMLISPSAPHACCLTKIELIIRPARDGTRGQGRRKGLEGLRIV